MSITQKQIERLNEGLPKGVHVVIGVSAGQKVTDEMVEAAIRYGHKMRERDLAKHPEPSRGNTPEATHTP